MSTIKVNNLTAPADNNFAIEMETGENMRVAGGMTNNYWTQFSIPSGTTSERPSAPVAGMLRFNTQTQYLEVYTGNAWSGLFMAQSGGMDGSSEASAPNSVQGLFDAGVSTDGNYYLNLDGTARKYFVPLASHPYYIVMANYGGGANAWFSNASALSGNQINDVGDSTPTGNFANNGTYGYYRNTGGSDYKYATVSRRGISYRYVKMRFNLYTYYSNDGVNGRNFLGISSGVGDGMTVMRNNSAEGDAQHVFTYYTAISNNDGNSCPSQAGMTPTMQAGGNNPGGFMSNRYNCFSRSGNGFTSEYVRNFSTLPGDNSGGTGPNVLTGDSWYTVDMGSDKSHDMHIVIHSDQDSGNEDTYIKRGVVLVRPA